ncbi:MAG: hypothetical protein RSB64_19505, partial [Pseudomonas sp.]
MLLIQKEKSSVDCEIERFTGTKGSLSAIGGYQILARGLPWPPGSGNTRCRPSAEKVSAMHHL